MDTALTDEMIAGFQDKDSKVERFRSLYEEHDFLTAYAKHTDLRVDDNPHRSVGREDEWRIQAILQLVFLIELGLTSGHKLLDVGCGVGRAARSFVPYLDVGNYTGIDISGQALKYATDLSKSEGWAKRKPTFLINSDIDLGEEFDFLWAHSVFTHLPDWQVEKMIRNAAGITRKKFAFTYKFAAKPRRSGLKQMQYPPSFFEDIALDCGFSFEDHPLVWPACQRTIVLTKA